MQIGGIVGQTFGFLEVIKMEYCKGQRFPLSPLSRNEKEWMA